MKAHTGSSSPCYQPRPGGFEPYDAPRVTLDQLEQIQAEKLAARPTVAAKPQTPPPFCELGHQPLDYDDFCLMVASVREWVGWPEPGRMAIGECIDCHSSITYPVPPGVSIDEIWYRCDDDTTGQIHDLIPIAGVDLAGEDDPTWRRIPASIRADIIRYIEHRMEPGGFVGALMAGEVYGMVDAATDDHARASIPHCVAWVRKHAPSGSYGSRANIAQWLRGQ